MIVSVPVLFPSSGWDPGDLLLIVPDGRSFVRSSGEYYRSKLLGDTAKVLLVLPSPLVLPAHGHRFLRSKSFLLRDTE